MQKAPVQYSPALEKLETDEAKTSQALVDSVNNQNRTTCDHYRHAVRGAHAKSHGILKGKLVVNGLSHEYAQGIFSQPKTYDIIVRLSTVPGDLLPDSVTTARGFALKVLGVEGQKASGHEGQTTQDFLFASGLTFPVTDLSSFLKQQKLLEESVDYLKRAKETVSLAARATNAVLGAVGLDNPKLGLMGYPPTHILADEFGTQAPIRYGAYVAKLCIRARSESVKKLADVKHHAHKEHSVIRDNVREFFKTQRAEYDLCAQLCIDPEKMPIEDATVAWSEKESPYVPVATLIFEPQDSYSPARQVFGDDALSFSPFHCVIEHQPLGRIMRARKKIYEDSSAFRFERNARPRIEPKSIAEMPD